MIPDLTTHLRSLTESGKLIQTPDGMWLDTPGLDVTRMAALANDLGMRLSTMTGIALETGETQLIYHFVSGSTVLNFKVQTQQNSIQSIALLIPTANWIEREIHDLYGVEFVGHP